MPREHKRAVQRGDSPVTFVLVRAGAFVAFLDCVVTFDVHSFGAPTFDDESGADEVMTSALP